MQLTVIQRYSFFNYKKMEKTKIGIAIVHDSMMEYGGAEKLLSYIIKLFPHADIYTSSFNKQVKNKITKRKVHTSFIHNLSWLKKRTSFIQLLSPIVWRSFDLSSYNLVITSSSFGLANTIKTNGTKIDYIHSLPKNLFDLSSSWNLQKIVPYTFFIKHFYLKNLKKSQHLIVNSQNTQHVVRQFTSNKATIIYPPISTPSKNYKTKSNIKPFFIMVSRLSQEKNIELAIRTFNQTSIQLLIVGNGKDLEYIAHLKKLAKPNIKFLGFVSNKKLTHLYSTALGFIHCHLNEDFGMVIAEAMAYGCPVIAYNCGGPKEIVSSGVNGEFFNHSTVSNLLQTINKFQQTNYDRQVIRKYARQFSVNNFNSSLLKYTNNVFV